MWLPFDEMAPYHYVVCFTNGWGIITNNVDLNISSDRGHVVLQLNGVGAFVWTDTWCNSQLCVRGLCHHGDAFVCRGQLLLTEGPLGDGGWVSSDRDFDGERVRNNHLQAVPEGTQVKGWTHCKGNT